MSKVMRPNNLALLSRQEGTLPYQLSSLIFHVIATRTDLDIGFPGSYASAISPKDLG